MESLKYHSKSDFVFGETLGAGSHSIVYKGKDKRTDEMFAIKEIPKAKKCMKENVEIEKNILASLNHPNINRCFGCFEDNNNIYYVMEYCVKSVQELIVNEISTLHIQDIQKIMGGVADALIYLHDSKFVHCDVSPRNILIGVDGCVRLTDFGSAIDLRKVKTPVVETEELKKKSCQNKRQQYLKIKKANQFRGTPLYAAPEMFTSKEKTEKVDVWSFGCVLFHLLANRPPFFGESLYWLMESINNLNYSFDTVPLSCVELLKPSILLDSDSLTLSLPSSSSSPSSSESSSFPLYSASVSSSLTSSQLASTSTLSTSTALTSAASVSAPGFDERSKDLLKKIFVIDSTSRPTMREVRNHVFFS